MILAHGGNRHETALRLGCPVEALIDLSGNLNPLGPPPGLMAHLSDHIKRISILPDTDTERIARAIALLFQLDPARVLAGNGTSSFIYSLPWALGIRKALILSPTYADYRDACLLAGADTATFATSADQNFDLDVDRFADACRRHDTVFICNPNNPTGMTLSPDTIRALCVAAPDTRFIVDETYMPFLPDMEKKSVTRLYQENLLILTSLSKIFTIPGLRLGFITGSPSLLGPVKRHGIPWTVNAMAQEAIFFLADQKEKTFQFIETTQQWLLDEKREMTRQLAGIPGLHAYPSTTIFQLLRLGGLIRADQVCASLEKDGILIRNCANIAGLSDRFIRFSLGLEKENRMLSNRLRGLLLQTP